MRLKNGSKGPVKLDCKERHVRSWNYTAAQGTQSYLDVSDQGSANFDNFAKPSSLLIFDDDGKQSLKKQRLVPKYRLINLNRTELDNSRCIGTFTVETEEDIAGEHGVGNTYSRLALRFDPSDPNRTLLLRLSSVDGVHFLSCRVIWRDLLDSMDERTYDCDDLLVDLANAGRLIACYVIFSGARKAIVNVKLNEVDQHFIPERDVVPAKTDFALAYLLRYFHGIGILFDPVGAVQRKLDCPLDWLKLFAAAKSFLCSNFSIFSESSSCDQRYLPISACNLLLGSRLATKLRPYQIAAVQWMVRREKTPSSQECTMFNSVFQRIFAVVNLSNESACFFNRLSCRPCSELPFETSIPTGGVLADEMGLGKTLEVLALMVLNPRPPDEDSMTPCIADYIANPERNGSTEVYFSCICGDLSKESELTGCSDCGSLQHTNCVGWTEAFDRQTYRCPYCILNYGIVNSRATLVVTPMTICAQWADEIVRHANVPSSTCTLKVFTYHGIKASGIYIQPRILADNDVVLVSYETLKSELANANLQFEDRSGSFRNTKRFMAVPSPLPAICWWRLCVDEAQMVESPTNAAQMVRRLQSVHRWCITGTPVTHSITDLLGLLVFLRYPLFSTPLYFNQLVAKPYFEGNSGPLVNLLSTMFWRTSKHSVLDQIGVPPVNESVTYLTFSPVEEHLYRHHYNANKMNSAVSALSHFERQMLLRHLDRRLVDRFLDPMTPLRRACSDFGKRSHIGPRNNNVNGMKMPMSLTMDQVLKDLVHRAKTVCTDYNRQHICCLNGLAGLNILKQNLKTAADLFRQVLWSARDNSEEICETDKLQLIHATHNLYEVLQMAKSSGNQTVDEATGDANLPQRELELVSAFVGKLDSRIQENKEAVAKAFDEILKVDSDFYDDWWAEICERLLRKLSDEDLCEFFLCLQNNLRDTCAGSHTLASQVNTPQSFMLALVKRLDALVNFRRSWRDAIFCGLMKTPHGDLSQQLSLCSCCTQLAQPNKANSANKESCAFCKAMKSCVEYEKVLFNARKNPNGFEKGDDDNSSNDVWAWSDSETERTLKFLLSFAKRNSKNFEISNSGTDLDELFESGDKHIARFQSLKSEFRYLRQLWMALKDRVGAEIELNMASNRFQLVGGNSFDGQQKTIIGTAFVTEGEIPKLMVENERNAEMAKFNFEKACGQLRYLRSLEKTVAKNGTISNEENCPVCMTQLGVSWAVLPCAHCVCLECVTTIRSMALRNRRLPCPVCRHTLEAHELAYVSLRPVDEVFPDEQIDINGNYSTKFMAVVKIIKVVLLRDPTAKFLVFSSWLEVLHSLAQVLSENKISALVLQKGGSTRKSLLKQGAPARDRFMQTLRRFRCSEKDGEGTISTLLLPYSSGANGLNLTEANHVILMDPCLTHSMDAQAIARVYRMGQTRPTTVHRLLVRSTIEERIYSVLLQKKTKQQHHELDNVIDGEENDEDDLMEDAIVGDLLDLFRSELDQGLKSTVNVD